MKKFAKPVAVGLVSLMALAITACNTVEGIGKDMESAGKKVEETAK